VLGFVENMSGYVCPGCGAVGPLFPDEAEEETLGLERLGRVPFDPELARLSDRGLALAELAGSGAPERPALAALRAVAGEMMHRLEETR
jgi:ATP-binding protein involved in chromosome partitioning